MKPLFAGKYLSRNPLKYQIEGNVKGFCKFTVVIPCLAEESHLPFTLKSLAANPLELLTDTLVLLVVNNSETCEDLKFQDNQRTLEALRLNKWEIPSCLNLAWIDASSKGKELPGNGGAGTARKLGMDAALRLMDSERGLIFSLDGDTLVSANYLQNARDIFANNAKLSGAVFKFSHQCGNSEQENRAITDYELFMRYYVMSLKYALSPYAYYSIGSAIVCTAGAYAASGGMREREAGEDFYFLQALRKIGEIGEINDACVEPSARVSDRVPFGTGPKMKELLDGGTIMLYNHGIFKILRAFMEKINSYDVDSLVRLHEDDSNELCVFLERSGFAADWPRIYKNTPKDAVRLRQAFHIWFDALKTLKFIHFMEEFHPETYQRESIDIAFSELLKNMNIAVSDECFKDRAVLLDWLRNQGFISSFLGASGFGSSGLG